MLYHHQCGVLDSEFRADIICCLVPTPNKTYRVNVYLIDMYLIASPMQQDHLHRSGNPENPSGSVDASAYAPSTSWVA